MARWHANASQWTGEILRDGALECDAFAARGVQERQLLRVESEPVKTELGAITAVVGTVPVVHVASNGMIDAPQVAADLMTTSGSWPRLDKRKPHIGYKEECIVFGH